jgi:predicted phage tail protein
MTDEMDGTQQTTPGSIDSEESASRLAAQIDVLTGMAGTTSRIVNRAASILEEELAAGIGVTQNIEQRFVDVDKLRSAESQEVIQRFRKDAHDVVDILLDLMNVATNTLGNLSERAVSIGISQPRQPEKKQSDGSVPALVVPATAKPGEVVEIPMALENASDKPTEAFFFHSSDLVNITGERIGAQQIAFSPEQLVIEPRTTTTVKVMVRVPEDVTPGIYSGLLQATRMDQLRAVLSIQVG